MKYSGDGATVNDRSVFSQFIETPKQEQSAEEPSPAQRTLDFLQRWPKDTISVRELQQFGPKSMRDRQSVIASAEVLVRHGWLAPTQGPQRNSRQWRVTRRPTVHPVVAP
jgi:hypothetical protein